MIRFYCFSLFFVASFNVVCQSKDEATRAILDSVYNNQFKGAQFLIDKNFAKESLEAKFLSVYIMRWKYIPISHSEFNSTYATKLRSLERTLDSIPDKESLNSLPIATHIFIAENALAKGQKLSAMNSLRKAYSLLEEKLLDNTNEADVYIGAYLYFTAHHAEQSFANRLLLMPFAAGDKEMGRHILQQTYASNSIQSIEAAIYLLQIYLFIEHRYEDALVITSHLNKFYPRNNKFLELYAFNMIKCKRYKQAVALVTELKQSQEPFYQCSIFLMEGLLAEEFYHNISNAKEAYNTSLNSSKQFEVHLRPYIKIAKERLKELGN